MPSQETVVETYWCPGWWPWQWFRTCRREVTKWCYYFDSVKEHRWLFLCIFWGCEDGVEYRHVGPCLGFGSHTFYDIRYCSSSQLTRSGTCGAGTSYGLRSGTLRSVLPFGGRRSQYVDRTTQLGRLSAPTRERESEAGVEDGSDCLPCRVGRTVAIGLTVVYLLRKLFGR